MPITLSGTYTSTYVLNNPTTQSPATITSTGLIDVTSPSAQGILGSSGFAWTIVNRGTVSSTGSSGAGIHLQSGGLVRNAAAGYIGGTFLGINIGSGDGTVVNHGRILSTQTAPSGGYHGAAINAGSNATLTVSNFGTIAALQTSGGAAAISLAAGKITNQSGAVIDGGGQFAIAGPASDAAVKITNYGTIRNNSSAATVVVGQGDTLTNAASGVIQASSTIGTGVSVGSGSAPVNNAGLITAGSVGINISGTANLANTGTIQATGSSGIGVRTNGGSIDNSGLISGTSRGVSIISTSGTVANSGAIQAAGTSGVGVYLSAGGTVSNAPGGTISGLHDGMIIQGGAGTVVNSGLISNTGPTGTTLFLGAGGIITNYGTVISAAGPVFGSSFYGVIVMPQPGTLINHGTISDMNAAFGVILIDGGTVTNESIGTPALIESAVEAVRLENGGGLITNGSGAVLLGASRGITLGGTTSNATTVSNSGTIIGGVGILAYGSNTADNRIINSGTITGTSGIAVDLGSGNDLVVVEAGAVFGGAVNGNGGNDILQFAQAGTHSLAGFSGFETVKLADGAKNSLAVPDSAFAGVSGASIAVSGGNNGDVINASALSAANSVVLNGEAGNDTLKGGGGNDTLKGGGGADTLNGGGGNDTLNGAAGADSLVGSTGTDTLNGGADTDVIDGGAGNDTLTGGTGPDQFLYKASGNGTDLIMDFSGQTAFGGGPGETDTFTFESVLQGAFAYRGANAFTGGGNTEARVSGSSVRLDFNGDGVGDLTITVNGLTSASQLVIADFKFI